MKKILKSTMILTIGSITARLLGLFFILYFPKYVNSEHLCFYSYSYSYFVLFLDISLLGVPQAVTNIISKYSKNDLNQALTLFRKTFKVIVLVSIMSFLIMLLLSNSYINNIGIDEGKDIVLKGILFVGLAVIGNTIIGMLRAYFHGFNEMKIASISLIIEQTTRIIFILISIYLFNSNQVLLIYLALLSCVIGQIFCIIYLLFNYKKQKYEVVKIDKKLIKTLMKNAFYIFLSVICLTSLSFIDTMTFKNALMKRSETNCDGIYSMYAFQANRLIFIPIMLSTSLSTSIVATLSAKRNKEEMKETITKVLKITFKVLFFFSVFFYTFADQIFSTLYVTNTKGIEILRYCSILIVFYGFYYVFVSLILSQNKLKYLSFGFIIAIIIKLLRNYAMIKKYSFYGAIMTDIACFSIIIIIGIIILRKSIKGKILLSILKDFLLITSIIILSTYILPSISDNVIERLIYLIVSFITILYIYFVLDYLIKFFIKNITIFYNSIKNKIRPI